MSPSSPDPAVLTPGEIVDGRFEIGELRGQGSFARVYRAADLESGKSVALKVLRWRSRDGGKAIARFQREMKLASSLHHPGIVPVLGGGVVATTDAPYIAMELIDGRSLLDVMGDGGLWSIDRILGLLDCICPALEHAWSHGVVHRDIKAANIMVTDEGDRPAYVLLDLGIAVQPDGGIRVTEDDEVVGTPSSLAPEQIRNEPVDHRTDLYAVGVLMYRLLTGRPPFHSDTHTGLAAEILCESAKPPSVYSEWGSAMIDAVVLRTMAKDPDDRFQTAAALAEAACVAAQAPRFRKSSRAPTRDTSEITRPHLTD